MTTLLVVLTVVEIVLVVAALCYYLVQIARHLRGVSTTLGKLAFGVRAVETQTGAIGPAVVRINSTLADIDGALPGIAEKAQRLAGSRP